ncbi:odorant receptor Or2-like [Schistocerca cancellata]|uniref:odorant receptor Or2-like n=1 Tax=Schistocerca cancellata TaxID=274614 RepID=UPI00211874B8|nr:odorant receptor Or2-like [Schistocerca cancellata]
MSWESEEAKQLTWEYATKSVLKCNIRILHMVGLWPLTDSLLFRSSTATIVVLCVAHIAEAAVNLCTLHGDLQDFTLALSNVSVVCVGVLKLTFFLRHERSYCRLVRVLDALVDSQREYVHAEPPLAALFKATQKRTVRVTIGFLVYAITQLVAWSFAPLIAAPGTRRLPFQQLPLTDATAFLIYELSYAMQVISIIFIALINCQMDCFFMATMLHTAAQLRILAARIKNLKLHNEDMRTIFRSDEEAEVQVSAERDVAYNNLCLCIKTHQQLVRFVRHLDRIMSPIAMMQLGLGVFNGCMLIFPAAYSAESDALVKCLAAVPTISTQLLLYCLGAHSVREQGESVSLAAYSCGWPDAPGCCRRALLLVMRRAQRPLALTAGGIYPIQRATFLSLQQQPQEQQ